MALRTEFGRLLDKLWTRRTDVLRRLVRPKPGTPLVFNRSVRNRGLRDLLEIASKLMIRKLAKRAFLDLGTQRKLHRIKGRGLDARGRDLVRFARRFPGPLIYVFWRGKQCLYVGKAARASRLAGYQRHAYQSEAESVEVFAIRARSQLPKAECLAVHLWEPKYNRVKPARVRWGKRCPVCRRHDVIKKQLTSLFPLL